MLLFVQGREAVAAEASVACVGYGCQAGGPSRCRPDHVAWRGGCVFAAVLTERERDRFPKGADAIIVATGFAAAH